MTRIALVSQNPMDRGAYLDQAGLLSNYMEDYSLMGFIVDHYQDALDIIRSRGIEVYEQQSGAAIGITAPQEILEIRDLLSAHDIDCSYADIADTLYQA